MEQVPFSVLDETRPVDRRCHIREPRVDGEASSHIYRKLRIGSLTEYEHLDKVFWRSRKHGFSLPEHRLIYDADDNPWLEVERLGGVRGDTLVDEVTKGTDSFLSSYGGVLESILEHPEEPFTTDQKFEQFMCDGDDFYVCDVEPRVAYLEAEPRFDSVANRRLSWAANNYVSAVTNLYEDDWVSASCMEKAVSVAEKALGLASYFKPYPSFHELESQHDALGGEHV